MDKNPFEKLLATAEALKRVEDICRRRFWSDQDADEALVYVLSELRRDDFKRLASFKGEAQPGTYLYTVANSLALDFQRKKLGRKRVPKVVERLGDWAVAVYKLICWRGYSLAEAYDQVAIRGEYQESFRRFLEETIPISKAPCRENPRFSSLSGASGEDGSDWELPDQGLNPLEAVLRKLDHQDRQTAAKLLRGLVENLPEADRLLVRLVYGSDHSLAAAAKAAGISAAQARKRVKGLLVGFKRELLARGVRAG